MFSRMPSVRIDRIEKIEITIPFPFIGEDLISDSAKLRLRSRLHTSWPIPQSLQLPSEEEKVDSTLLKTLDYVSKGVSILSGIAVIVFVGLLWSGQTTIGSVQIGTLLTIFSFTLVSGLISIGGGQDVLNQRQSSQGPGQDRARYYNGKRMSFPGHLCWKTDRLASPWKSVLL